MDVVVNFPSRAICHWSGINSEATKRLTIGFLPSKRKCKLHLDNIVVQGHNIKKNVLNKTWGSKRISVTASKKEIQSESSRSSPAAIVGWFYKCINEKDLQYLDECISQNACFDDYSFTKSFEGRQEIMRFLEQLTDGMGRNVKFRVKRIYEGNDLTAAASWHLEWKNKQIPFTRGCSFFQLSDEGENNLAIWRAEVLIESPIKPGSIVLTLLKNITSIFDDFPKATEWFLRSPHTILTWILRIQNLFVSPLLNPLLGGYIKLWSFFVRLFSHAVSVVIYITKIFFK